ncbi:MAG TPA: hypothetical protein VMS76_05345 [Planctomycetota bacterium]|nr:hypothetical protein [Planctomycetota bacterium]
MRSTSFLQTAFAACALAAGAFAQSGSITTTFVANNQGSIGGANYFDVNVTNPAGLTITNFDVHCSTSTPAGTNFTVEVYTTPMTYMGKEANIGLWTLVGSGNAVSNATTIPTPVDTSDFVLPQGQVGMAIRFISAGLRYTNGTGSNQNYSNADIALALGSATNVAFSGTPFTPRVWNGTIYYNIGGGGCTGNPAVYCTSKVNSAGCTPSIGATGTPSASAGSGFVLTTINELDNRFGLYFYSKTGANNALFQGGFLCGTPPLVRTPVQNSGGTPPCGGAYTMDFNAYVAGGADPALVSGQQVWVQTWSRDPASPSTTNLSDAITVTLGP